ncbi:threonine aldolase family protein [Labrys wisconsinensis]|uniref:Threonine aldolase n=1 Tax=Labrys wisconsinensis TaxID=425677 RepID=A0ABU0JIV8_9HYPH|nr:aminotransferase class I/II-fold pyridoxal phosphate-dependent enzyme [Labrys wisconsinensis]MDQ0474221.1 threonine aldolase [Labrys wisconsinensis]
MYDLRSDVLAPLAPAVLQALAAAAQRQPGFGRHEDEEERRLVREAADLCGFEDGLFVPTGTLANQIALRLWCAPGEAVLAERESHVAVNEVAATAALNGVVVRPVEGRRGHLAPAMVEAALAIRSGSASERRTRLVWLENTHNRAGGTVMPAGWLDGIAAICRGRGLHLHVDGARIWHAAVAAGTAPAEAVRGASSVMVGLNKILGAPVGALLLASRDAIDEAARIQKMFGGLWRPVGPLAAAARVALAGYRPRAKAAHEAAAVFAARLAAELGNAVCDPVPDTNIVMLDFGGEAAVDALLTRLSDQPVRVAPYRNGRVRCVLHAGLSPRDARDAAELICRAAPDAPDQACGDGP